MEQFKNLIRQNKSLLLFICLLATFRGAIADWHQVPTGSMKPTILEGDVIWHNKIAYDLKVPFTNIKVVKLSDPERGDIVVVNSLRADKRLVKRLIGLPGDVITVEKNQIMINGVPAHYEPLGSLELGKIRSVDRDLGQYAIEQAAGIPSHVVHTRATGGTGQRSQRAVVPQGHYFLMGDNRDNSADSRYYGAFSREELQGRATHILLSMNMLDSYKPRFERFLHRLQ